MNAAVNPGTGNAGRLFTAGGGRTEETEARDVIGAQTERYRHGACALEALPTSVIHELLGHVKPDANSLLLKCCNCCKISAQTVAYYAYTNATQGRISAGFCRHTGRKARNNVDDV